MLLSSVLQIYSANRFRETPELERLFLSLFAELSNTADFSVKGPDKETIRLIDALRSEGLRPLEEIAVKLGSTEEHITEYVKQTYGRDVSDLLREKRMKYAGELLSDKRMSLYLIAEKCGYTNVSAFSDDFKQYYGTSPEEYREQMV